MNSIKFIGMVIHAMDENLYEELKIYSDSHKVEKYRMDLNLHMLLEFIMNEVNQQKIMYELQEENGELPTNQEIQKRKEDILKLNLIDAKSKMESAFGVEVFVDSSGFYFMTDYNKDAKFNTFSTEYQGNIVTKMTYSEPDENGVREPLGFGQFSEEPIWKQIYPEVTYKVETILKNPDAFMLSESLNDQVVGFSFPSNIVNPYNDSEPSWLSRCPLDDNGDRGVQEFDMESWNKKVIEILESQKDKMVTFVEFKF